MSDGIQCFSSLKITGLVYRSDITEPGKALKSELMWTHSGELHGYTDQCGSMFITYDEKVINYRQSRRGKTHT